VDAVGVEDVADVAYADEGDRDRSTEVANLEDRFHSVGDVAAAAVAVLGDDVAELTKLDAEGGKGAREGSDREEEGPSVEVGEEPKDFHLQLGSLRRELLA
jgi:hypothetical protein